MGSRNYLWILWCMVPNRFGIRWEVLIQKVSLSFGARKRDQVLVLQVLEFHVWFYIPQKYGSNLPIPIPGHLRSLIPILIPKSLILVAISISGGLILESIAESKLCLPGPYQQLNTTSSIEWHNILVAAGQKEILVYSLRSDSLVLHTRVRKGSLNSVSSFPSNKVIKLVHVWWRWYHSYTRWCYVHAI